MQMAHMRLIISRESLSCIPIWVCVTPTGSVGSACQRVCAPNKFGRADAPTGPSMIHRRQPVCPRPPCPRTTHTYIPTIQDLQTPRHTHTDARQTTHTYVPAKTYTHPYAHSDRLNASSAHAHKMYASTMGWCVVVGCVFFCSNRRRQGRPTDPTLREKAFGAGERRSSASTSSTRSRTPMMGAESTANVRTIGNR